MKNISQNIRKVICGQVERQISIRSGKLTEQLEVPKWI